MNLIQRITNITLTPKTEWPVVDAETTTTSQLFTNYIMLVSAIPAVATLIGMSLFGISVPFLGSVRVPIVSGLTTMILSYGLGLLGVYLISLIIDALAPTFGGQKNSLQALKVTAFAFTPAWVAGILHLVPTLGVLGILAGFYSIYVLYLGLPVLMKAPQDKAVAYTAVSVICAIVTMVIVGAIVGSVTALTGLSSYRNANFSGNATEFEASGALGELAKAGKKFEDAGKKLEEANKSGSQQAQADAQAAATQALGAALGGEVEVVDKDKLKALLPENLGGLKRTSVSAEKTAMGGFSISKAEAQYGDDANHRIRLVVTDTGGSKLLGAAFTFGLIESEKETENGYEKTGKVDGRPSHEQFRKSDSSGEFTVYVANRFIVEAKGEQVDMATIKSAASAVGFAKLEAMKDEGAKK